MPVVLDMLDVVIEGEEGNEVRVVGVDTANDLDEVMADLVMDTEDDKDDEGPPTMIPVTEGMGGGPVSVLCR